MDDRTIDVAGGDVSLRDLIQRHGPSARLILEDGDRVIGKLVLKPRAPRPARGKRIIGLHRGNVLHMANDFDAPLPDEFWLGEDV